MATRCGVRSCHPLFAFRFPFSAIHYLLGSIPAAVSDFLVHTLLRQTSGIGSPIESIKDISISCYCIHFLSVLVLRASSPLSLSLSIVEFHLLAYGGRHPKEEEVIPWPKRRYQDREIAPHLEYRWFSNTTTLSIVAGRS